ncbi:hypothetical protein [Paenibacillus amylolyticus]|uniref:hypothetical protein n=1 Tax=Paenibacillus amylolyticus TaxID=1451 RepID=UPI003EBD5B4F
MLLKKVNAWPWDARFDVDGSSGRLLFPGFSDSFLARAAVKTREQRRTLRSFVNHSTSTLDPAAIFFLNA